MGQIVADFNSDTGQFLGFRNKSEAEIGFGWSEADSPARVFAHLCEYPDDNDREVPTR